VVYDMVVLCDRQAVPLVPLVGTPAPVSGADTPIRSRHRQMSNVVDTV
jgi:hypothetical protein